MKKKIIVSISYVICAIAIFLVCVSNNEIKNDENKVASKENEVVKDTEIEETEENGVEEIVNEDEESNEEVNINDETLNVEDVNEVNTYNVEATNNDIETNSSNSEEASNSNVANNNTTTGNSNNGSANNQQGNNNGAIVETPEKEEVKSKYKDGTYTGSGSGFKGLVTVSVVISGDLIKSIEVTNYSDNEGFMKEAKKVIDRIISSQSTSVDTVSGATFSSKGIISAVEDALNSAKN